MRVFVHATTGHPTTGRWRAHQELEDRIEKNGMNGVGGGWWHCIAERFPDGYNDVWVADRHVVAIEVDPN